MRVASTLGALVITFAVVLALTACGGSKSQASSAGHGGSGGGTGSGICGSSSSPSSCVELTENDLGQTFLAYPNDVLRAYRNGRRVDVYTDLTDSQRALAKNVCLQVSIDVHPDGVGLDIPNPEIVLWSTDDTILATGPTGGSLGCTAS